MSRWGRHPRARAVVAILVFMIAQAAMSRAIQAAPKQGYRLVVLGDSLGDGIWAGLKRLMRNEKGIDVVRKSRVSTGFARPDYYDWNAALPEILAEAPVDAAIVVMGTNDQQPMRVGRSRAQVLSKEWRVVYEQRAREFAEILARRGVATYWVGLPVMRSPKFSRTAARLNSIFRDISGSFGHTYVDTWREFADSRGRYDAYGPDLSGRVRKLRANDGIHFTMPGYERFAKPVAEKILNDLAHAALPAGHGARQAAMPSKAAGGDGEPTVAADAPPMPILRPEFPLPLRLRGSVL